MTRYGLVIEADRCIGCNNCIDACKDEFVGNDYPPYSAAQPETQYGYYPGAGADGPVTTGKAWVKQGQNWIDDQEFVLGRFPHLKSAYVPLPCMHCEKAPCQKAATGGAVYTRSDGIVLIDPTKGAGQSQLVSACPYGRIYWNSDSNIPQKCTLCAHLVDQGLNPRCVEACPVTVLHFGDLDDPNSDASAFLASRKAEPMHPEYEAKPKVFYAGLPKPFVTGRVANGQTGDLVAGVSVTLTDGGGLSLSGTTDFLGDFEFEGLKPAHTYFVSFSKQGFNQKKMVVYLDVAKDMGKVPLSLM